MLGAGLRWMGEKPHLCRRCRHLTLVDGGPVGEALDSDLPERKGRCSKCRRLAEPWPVYDDHFEPVTPAECPRCQKLSVQCLPLGIWD